MGRGSRPQDSTDFSVSEHISIHSSTCPARLVAWPGRDPSAHESAYPSLGYGLAHGNLNLRIKDRKVVVPRLLAGVSEEGAQGCRGGCGTFHKIPRACQSSQG